MDYEKKYKAALNWMKNVYPTLEGATKEDAEHYFPELKESEDERIRKIIKQSLKSYFEGKLSIGTNDVDYAMCLSWLKKQGEHKPVEWNREDEQNLNACLGYIPDEFLRRWLTDAIHVKYDKPADKVEPKFKVGDIIKPKDGGHEPWQIMQVDILDKKYRLKKGYVIHFSQEDDYELVEQKPA